MARMRQVPDIPVPPHEIVELAPGGLHVILIGVEEPLMEGNELEIVLIFERAGEISVKVPVRSISGRSHHH